MKKKWRGELETIDLWIHEWIDWDVRITFRKYSDLNTSIS